MVADLELLKDERREAMLLDSQNSPIEEVGALERLPEIILLRLLPPPEKEL